MKIVMALKDRVGHWGLPVLTGIINAPTMREDGSILETSGYDAATGLLFDPRGVSFPKVPDQPTREDAQKSLKLLKGLVVTFPFVSDADQSVAVSGILTVLCAVCCQRFRCWRSPRRRRDLGRAW